MNFFDKKSRRLHLQNPAGRNRNSGQTLVESMIAIAIGLVLLAGVTTMIAHQSSARSELEKSSRQIENGRYASQVLKEDIQLAGYFGKYVSTSAPPATLPDPCATDLTTLDAAISLPVQGYDAPSTVPSPLSACVSDADHIAGTDILVLRRTDTTPLEVASAVTGQVYMQDGFQTASPSFLHVLGSGSDTSGFTLRKKDLVTLAPLRKFVVHIYFLSPCNVPASGTSCTGSSDDESKPIPTLKMLDLTVAGGIASLTKVPLAEGIENLQFDYGIDTSNDGAPDSYAADPGAPAAWQNVVTIRVNLLARTNDGTAGYATNQAYNMGSAGTVGPFTDNYKRRVFSEVVRVVNPSARREQ